MKTPRAKPNPTARPARLPWRRILVPLDFSKDSLHAFSAAVPLARGCGAELLLLAAIEPAMYASGLETVLLATPRATLERNFQAALLRLARRYVPEGVAVAICVRQGAAASVIRRVAREKRIDLIVLSRHGRSALYRALLGGTAERVVRNATCSVLVVPRRS